MTDKEWKKKMDKVIQLKELYYSELSVIEGEYEKRFGTLPSEISDDYWIDTFHSPGSSIISIEEIKSSPSLQRFLFNKK